VADVKDKSKNNQRSWAIGKTTERKTVDYLKSNGYAVIKTEVDHQGIDIIAGKGGTLYFIEVKGTEDANKSWKAAFPLKQRKSYYNLCEQWKQCGFTVITQLYFWKKISGRWKLDIIKF
jgi:Holliday junction resolvase-like predicted endonuclease